jgi:50S ribosomal protein L16 3-hydroxylase
LLDFDDFVAAVAEHGVALDLKSQMLYSEDCIYLNGEILEYAAESQTALQTLANTRLLEAGDYDDSLLETLFTYYEYGYLTPNA